MEESDLLLEHPAAAKFRSHVMDGEWEKVCALIQRGPNASITVSQLHFIFSGRARSSRVETSIRMPLEYNCEQCFNL
jgi:hypothetical protein